MRFHWKLSEVSVAQMQQAAAGCGADVHISSHFWRVNDNSVKKREKRF